ncbi:MAG: hypothetical protein SGJ18_09920 [Pseudomonadota bacterium]|nr:hypothetical protein [Pseudomonadota bacterium]
MIQTGEAHKDFAVAQATERKRLIGKIKSVNSLSETEINEMYHLFIRYYENTSLQKFRDDLLRKRDVLLASTDKQIIGFTTITEMKFTTSTNQLVVGLFSGDTIVNQLYWGKTPLKRLFFVYLWRQKIKYPFVPVYWLLISKGYKTYLILTNNFLSYFPQAKRSTPVHIKDILNQYARDLYGDRYDASTGLIYSQGKNDHIKNGVAPVDSHLRSQNINIKFFVEQNPNWQQGDELVCLARVDFLSLLFGFLKAIFKSKFQKSKQTE